MARNPTFPLYDSALGGELIPLLSEWKAEGISLQEMTWRLRERLVPLGLSPVSPDTVRRWLRQLDAEAVA